MVGVSFIPPFIPFFAFIVTVAAKDPIEWARDVSSVLYHCDGARGREIPRTFASLWGSGIQHVTSTKLFPFSSLIGLVGLVGLLTAMEWIHSLWNPASHRQL